MDALKYNSDFNDIYLGVSSSSQEKRPSCLLDELHPTSNSLPPWASDGERGPRPRDDDNIRIPGSVKKSFVQQIQQTSDGVINMGIDSLELDLTCSPE